jgi:tetratricopeptide (TPR) repeat protein
MACGRTREHSKIHVKRDLWLLFFQPLWVARHRLKVWDILKAAPSSEAGAALRRQAAPQLLLFGFRLGMASERVAEVFAEGKALAVAAGDVREQVSLHYALGLIYTADRHPRRGFAIFEEGIVLADRSGDPELRWSARTAFDFALWVAGDLSAAQDMNDQQLALAEIDPALGIATIGLSTADSLWHRAVILTDLGRLQEAGEMFGRADERARHFADNEMASWIDFFRTRVLVFAGDASAAMSMGRRAIESAEKIGATLGRIGAYGHYGMACVVGEEWQSARESLELALELGRINQVGRFLDAN